ncbi:GntR family transcriptional regulator [Duganella aceris]|jgi:DNA-binding GntR family transcriptional regulator|uniref:GntR family transcriptional regulator n=1 Tax=Duganella aceris TaxID=2703883 RepID=A0ABX0FIX5_9BURK|nr:GntR family transcriptional regulator [Duganella aceris]NGZ84550.1 GntR family transcriptional regulator [Duganella aceris]
MEKNTSKPHFADIARDLTEGIAAGRFPVGSVLPGELELCGTYGTSRHTIRAALHELQQLGLVSRKKNAGTRVESAAPKNDFRPSLGSLEDLIQFGSTNRRVVQSIDVSVVGGELAKTLGCVSGAQWLKISSLRVDGETQRPIGWTDVYVNPEFADIAEVVRAEPDTLVSTLIERRYGRRVAEIRQVVKAVSLAEPEARALQAQAGMAGLEIVRQYFDASGKIFEASVTVHPSDRFAVAMRLQRSE